MPFHIWENTSHVHPPKGLVINKVVMTLMEPFTSKVRNVTTDNFFTLFLLAKELKKKKASLVGTTYEQGYLSCLHLQNACNNVILVSS